MIEEFDQVYNYSPHSEYNNSLFNQIKENCFTRVFKQNGIEEKEPFVEAYKNCFRNTLSVYRQTIMLMKIEGKQERIEMPYFYQKVSEEDEE